MLASVDVDCAVNVTIKQGIELALQNGLENSRQRIHQTCVEILRCAKNGGQSVGQHQPYGTYNQQQAPAPASPSGGIPPSLMLLPLYSMSMQKNLTLRGGTDVRPDERAFFHSIMLNMGIDESKVFIYPRMFSIHDMSLDAGTSSDNTDDVPTAGVNHVRLPVILNLSHERLMTDGMVLLENGYDLYLWIGRNVNPALLDTLFGVSSLDNVDMSHLRIQQDSSDFSCRFMAIIEALRSERSRYLQLHFIKEGDGHAEAYFARFLVEDRYLYFYILLF
jgi:protein transport protein SEC24